jgi:peptidoglycan hydrolase-like protein with peptidoglycan-binding domain
MRGFLLWAAMVAMLVGGAVGAQAQGQAWVQIEAQPTLREAEERARAYSGAFPDVSGYVLASGWHAIVLGPYATAEAPARLAALLSERLVPGDSFVADGRNFRRQYWPPAGAAPVAPPAPAAPAPEAAATAAPAAPATPALPAAAPPDETPAEARRSEAALNPDQRRDLQAALQWFGHYAAAIDGAIGPGTRSAMAAWQTAQGFEPTGVLTARQRDALVGAWRAELAELGLQRVADAEAGIEIDLPMGLVAFDRYDPPFVHYAAKGDSGMRVLLISLPGDQAALYGLYDLLQTLEIVPTDGPRERRARNFEIEGRNGTVASLSYAELSGGLIKGFILVWRPGDDARAGRAAVAMRASFRPIGSRALDPGLAPMDAAVRSGMLAGLEVRRPERSRTGFYADARGSVITALAAVEGCSRLTIDGGQEVDIALADPALGLAVLRPRAALVPQGFGRIAAALPPPGAEISVAGYSFEDALDRPTMTFGRFEEPRGLNGEGSLARLSLEALPGDGGGPVLDASGAVVGVLLPRTTGGNRVLPADVSFIAPLVGLGGRLAAAGAEVVAADRQGALAPEDLTVIGTEIAVMVSCWR